MAKKEHIEEQPETMAEPEPAPKATPAPVRAVEKWAEAKGLWPQFTDVAAQVMPGQHGGVVAIRMSDIGAKTVNHEFWRFAAAKALYSWPQGKEMTEAEFDAAIAAAAGQQAR